MPNGSIYDNGSILVPTHNQKNLNQSHYKVNVSEANPRSINHPEAGNENYSSPSNLNRSI